MCRFSLAEYIKKNKQLQKFAKQKKIVYHKQNKLRGKYTKQNLSESGRVELEWEVICVGVGEGRDSERWGKEGEIVRSERVKLFGERERDKKTEVGKTKMRMKK